MTSASNRKNLHLVYTCTNTTDDRDAITIEKEIHLSTTNTIKPDLSVNTNIAAVEEGLLEAVTYHTNKGAKQNIYDKMDLLYFEAQCGYLDSVKYLISLGEDVNEENDNGMIPLHGAASRGHIEVMEYLIQQGSDVNKADAKGRTPFNAAVQEGHIETVKYLMTQGAKQNRYDGMTPIYAAAQYGHLDIVKVLVSKGADVNEENDNGMIPLHGAAFGGHLEVMEYLIHQGSDVNKADTEGRTPFNAAVQAGHIETVKYLMIEGAKQNRYDGMTPLSAAATYGHLDIVQFFIFNGADVNEEGDEGWTPLHGAAAGGHLKIMEYLIQQGSDVNKSEDDDWTPFNAAVQEGHIEAVKYLMTEGAKQNRYDGMTPLYAAAQYGHLDSVKVLVSNGADVNGEDDERRIPLHGAASRGHVEVMKYLIQQGSELNRNDNTGRTPFYAAIEYDYFGAAMYLSSDQKKRLIRMTSLFTDPLLGELDFVKVCISNGADVNKEDHEGNIPLHGAAFEGHIEVIKYRIQESEMNTNNNNKEEHNSFVHAKLKYPEEGEQDPKLDQLKTMKSPVTTHDAGDFSPRGSQTWQYNRVDPPYLQTMEADGHPSEEPESRCQSLIDENREIRESSSPMNAGDDLPINEPSEIDSFPKHPPDVVHQKLYDGNPVSTHGTSSNQVRKIGTKRRTSVYRCSSFLALVHTFLQMIIALAIILAGSPVLVVGIDITERVTLQAGEPGMVPFHLPLPPIGSPQAVPYYTIRFESQPRPFCINGQADIEGFKSSSQLRRFTTSVTDVDTSPCVNLMIDDVDTVDEDGYVLTTVWHSFENVRYETMKKDLVVHIPPGPAKCFITLSGNDDYPYEVHCRATTGSVATTLSCYQNDRNIDVKGDITVNGLITNGIFLLLDYTHFSCCSHDVTLHVNETTCNDFDWPPSKETTRQTVNIVPTSVTTPTPQVESHTESGACRQFTLPSLWHFTYLFINLLAFVTMY